jgi:chromatin segregation and condensation protein Rec8/ScpA/Scc1 (kleisin family)
MLLQLKSETLLPRSQSKEREQENQQDKTGQSKQNITISKFKSVTSPYL